MIYHSVSDVTGWIAEMGIDRTVVYGHQSVSSLLSPLIWHCELTIYAEHHVQMTTALPTVSILLPQQMEQVVSRATDGIHLILAKSTMRSEDKEKTYMGISNLIL